MEKELTKNFNNLNTVQENNFDSIKITLASPDKIKSWSYGEIKNQRQLITEPSGQKKTDFFVLEYLVRLKIMSVYVVNIKG